jgi:hypothetical protein
MTYNNSLKRLHQLPKHDFIKTGKLGESKCCRCKMIKRIDNRTSKMLYFINDIEVKK